MNSKLQIKFRTAELLLFTVVTIDYIYVSLTLLTSFSLLISLWIIPPPLWRKFNFYYISAPCMATYFFTFFGTVLLMVPFN